MRIWEGNPGHRPIPNPPAVPTSAARCPVWLDELAKKEWRRVAPLLERMHILTALDVGVLVGYCQSYSELQQATEVLQRRGRTFTTPSGYKQQRPEVGIAHRAMLNMHVFAGVLGMSPSARMRFAAEDSDLDEGDLGGILS